MFALLVVSYYLVTATIYDLKPDSHGTLDGLANHIFG